ncbi:MULTISPECIES: universal stress protein [Trichocoleus]|uniref:Universal stress protein n=1 Tax=Trichocoleus desertorum GB2-A4 TaxID=2933944 RepID=A0ABV0JBM9_9CYAN|nr:universal stress protein [Trichocoleus sp. FACHB-46]MBD1860973.1 universal stress protein [Trichocoleus sp. FACHB-46]
MFKTVLFPIDQSRESRQAADTVAELVKFHHSRLVIVSVVETPEPGEEVPSAEMASPEAIAELLKTARNLFSDQGINTELIEREGKPAFTICDVADELDADLIIMGCRGLGLTEEGAADSVTNRVINLAPCPVLIVP